MSKEVSQQPFDRDMIAVLLGIRMAGSVVSREQIALYYDISNGKTEVFDRALNSVVESKAVIKGGYDLVLADDIAKKKKNQEQLQRDPRQLGWRDQTVESIDDEIKILEERIDVWKRWNSGDIGDAVFDSDPEKYKKEYYKLRDDIRDEIGDSLGIPR